MRKKDKDVADDSHDFSGLPASTTITPAGIQEKEFRVSRFGGYRMRDVDEFLDQVTEAMTKLTGDNERLRSAGALPVISAPLPIGAPDLADTSRQADEMIARATSKTARGSPPAEMSTPSLKCQRASCTAIARSAADPSAAGSAGTLG